MRIAYITTEEVNQNLAAGMAGKCGAYVCARLPLVPLPDGQFDAVLYDLDDLQKHKRGEFVALILSSPSNLPRAIHGYAITDEQAKALRHHGVAVVQRLRASLIRSLCKAAQPSRENVPADDAVTELTWVNLVN
jgi:hypothetical protein